MANRWGNNGNSDRLFFLVHKITADGDCSHEIKRRLLLGRKAMTNLDSILNRDITLLTNVHLVKPVVFPVVIYGCESWTIKKAERQRIDAFELWCWGRLLRVPWTSRRWNQSILKDISPEYSLEGLMLKLKLPILWPPYANNWLIGEKNSAWKDWKQEEKGTTEDEMLDGLINSMDMSLSKLRKLVNDREAWYAAVHEITKSWTQLSDWTELTFKSNQAGTLFSPEYFSSCSSFLWASWEGSQVNNKFDKMITDLMRW